MQNNQVQKVVFLDRDGVINRDSDEYIKSPLEFNFLPKSIPALKLLAENGFDSIVITNQSAVNRHMISEGGLAGIHDKMLKEAAEGGGSILDIFYCPHVPEDRCQCRKPEPGLIFSAREKYNIDLSLSYMVGDSAKDVECAKNAGCGCSILVRTGNFSDAKKLLSEKGITPDHIAENLYEAVRWIISHYRRRAGKV